MSQLKLSIATTDYDHFRDMRLGVVKPEGIDLVPNVLHPSELFWRQLRFAEFDVSEMSMSSLTIATSQEPTGWVMIPVFTTREGLPIRLPGRRQLRTIAINATGVLSLLVGLAASSEWMTWLSWSHAAPFGQVDPILGRDIAFHVFTVPFLQFVRGLGQGLVVLAALDNLTKGASGGAMQAANVALGLPEDSGLSHVGMYP